MFLFLVNVHFKKNKNLEVRLVRVDLFLCAALFISYSSNAPSVKVLNKVDHWNLLIFNSKDFKSRNNPASLHVKYSARFECFHQVISKIFKSHFLIFFKYNKTRVFTALTS